MKATNLLEAQHKEVKSLFKNLEKSENDEEKRVLFQELASNLVAHDAIEREIFYPMCKKIMGPSKMLGEAMVEHGVIEFSLYLADQAQGKDDFDEKVVVLSEMVQHHVKEEEDEFFPRVEKVMGGALLVQLAAQMLVRFEELKLADFRGPLHKNLRLVLEGATELPRGKVTKSDAGALHLTNGNDAKSPAAKSHTAKNHGAEKTASHGKAHS